MTSIDLVRRLHQHRMWANHQLLFAVADLSDAQLRQRFSIGQGSVWATLLHLMAAEYVWLEALEGNDNPLFPGDLPGRLPGNQQGPNPVGSLEELKRQWQQLDARWVTYLDTLTEIALEETVSKVSTSSRHGQRLGTRRVDILLHLCTHAQYTTAQLVNMLRQLGRSDLPDVMLISLARSESSGSEMNSR